MRGSFGRIEWPPGADCISEEDLTVMLKKQKKLILTEANQEAMRRAGRVNGQLMDLF